MAGDGQDDPMVPMIVVLDLDYNYLILQTDADSWDLGVDDLPLGLLVLRGQGAGSAGLSRPPSPPLADYMNGWMCD